MNDMNLEKKGEAQAAAQPQAAQPKAAPAAAAPAAARPAAAAPAQPAKNQIEPECVAPEALRERMETLKNKEGFDFLENLTGFTGRPTALAWSISSSRRPTQAAA